jgi:(2Fe-2S) ferredoxin
LCVTFRINKYLPIHKVSTFTKYTISTKEKKMALPEKQILVCQSFRSKGDPKGICHKQTDGFLQYIEEEILDRGLDMQVIATGCLKQCESGPIMVVQPNNWWFKNISSEDAIDAVLDGVEDGEPPAEYLITA